MICYLGEEEAPVEAEARYCISLKLKWSALLSVADPHQLNIAVGLKIFRRKD